MTQNNLYVCPGHNSVNKHIIILGTVVENHNFCFYSQNLIFSPFSECVGGGGEGVGKKCSVETIENNKNQLVECNSIKTRFFDSIRLIIIVTEIVVII